eukprot:TRINITY_DN2183_c0_g1_i1.p1 TRINITY_DN2183_c0_g1~~TRINITY_DN2183_c0_g1_i1.p1  ORF type:complete len:790 (-),score=195.57 TRINITY_DN2183_c0_g1_i1:112-2358(-)
MPAKGLVNALVALSLGEASAHVAREGNSLSPVTRIVDLLKDLSAQVEKEGKTEEGLYQKYVCWATSNVDAKTQSNTKAQTRIDSLSTYIADLDAGRIELTTERADLQKELAQLNSDLETAANLRAKQKDEYESAKTEMDQGITALGDALRVLGEATSSKSLLSLKGTVSASTNSGVQAGYAARVAEAASLAYAADLADKTLTRADARFLRRILTGDVPVKDWKKLNRKATFKKSYKARSGDIMATLQKLKATFEKNLAEATKKEEEAKSLYDKLADAKGKQKAAAEDALVKMEKEGGARGLSKAEAQAEVDDLTTQVADDKKFIGTLQSSLDTKKSEYKARVDLRTQELAAISKAISVLHSDDARDLFKKSLASQGYSFLQVGAERHGAIAASQVSRLLEKLTVGAGRDQAQRLKALTSRIEMVAAAGSHFDRVISAIDGMVKTLQDAETNELKTKEKCESDRESNSRAALLASRSIDEMTDKISSLKADIAEIVTEVDEKNATVKSINLALEEAKELRESQAKEHAAAKADDEAALALLRQATQVLKNFYEVNGLMLISKKQAPVSAAGEAPPPPPTTWDGAYGGKTGESTGIIALLEMTEQDVEKDIEKADAEETDAITAYNKLKGEQEQEISDLEGAISTLLGTKGDKESTIVSTEGEQGTKREELTATLKTLKDLQPGCDFVAVNFEVRSSNRQTEIDGLHKAKAILQGAEFSDVEGGGASLAQQAKKVGAFSSPRRLAVRALP